MIGLGRVSTAMITPFDKKGHINFPKTTQLINYLINNGTDSLIIAGTTGESPTLSKEEKIALFQHAVQVADKRVPIIAGTGSNDTYATIELTKRAEQAGADGIMVVAPYYNKPNQEGFYQHFKAVAENTDLPVMVYNVPGRSAANIEPETIIRLSKIPNIFAVKEASGNLNAMAKIISETDKDFLVYSGDDGLTIPVLAIGGDGVVSVASHIIGNEMQTMIRAFMTGETEKAAQLHRDLLPIMEGLFAAPSPVPVKTALQLKGLDVGSVRLPLVPLTEQERSKLNALIN
ncbi:4-hydroxy-tetrahydrodipicolinate synthase [Bacillus sp. S/N-304-OC-R1]|uniref:4-hydroxy-tetrahydrodipicolinate synthase n=1 Tax=Bacillus sp. S/N-304-OC-R1 TaxID=2758034 RepID=UPI001C8E8C5B|nr:4-hydroxy-tetrahydrodipicolinate synthase [Bacillus sp. S/N-304-OC-R1]MBY0120638.1 4-hydroxy-tetrahydrodipicolinate synthase [Bacillus sp. S/N-304-OC-R1]